MGNVSLSKCTCVLKTCQTLSIKKKLTLSNSGEMREKGEVEGMYDSP